MKIPALVPGVVLDITLDMRLGLQFRAEMDVDGTRLVVARVLPLSRLDDPTSDLFLGGMLEDLAMSAGRRLVFAE